MIKENKSAMFHIERTLICVGCGDPFSITWKTISSKLLREESKEEGWIYKNKNDYCEECKMSANVMFS